MLITDIKIRKIQGVEKIKAYATVTFENCFVIHDLKILLGNSGILIAMPSRMSKNGKYKDVAHPITKEFREYMQKHILEAYNKVQDNAIIDCLIGKY